jgi:hypothetical protein
MKPQYAVPGLLGITGGFAWIALASFMPAWGPPGTAAYERYQAAVQLWVFAFALMAVGFLGLTARYRFAATLLGKAGAAIVTIGFVAMMVGNVAEFRLLSDLPYDPDNVRTTAWLTLLAGLLAALVGVFMLGVEALRSGRLPHWAGVGLVAALLAGHGSGIRVGTAFSIAAWPGCHRIRRSGGVAGPSRNRGGRK